VGFGQRVVFLLMRSLVPGVVHSHLHGRCFLALGAFCRLRCSDYLFFMAGRQPAAYMRRCLFLPSLNYSLIDPTAYNIYQSATSTVPLLEHAYLYHFLPLAGSTIPVITSLSKQIIRQRQDGSLRSTIYPCCTQEVPSVSQSDSHDAKDVDFYDENDQ
jgi:hypothetical protein